MHTICLLYYYASLLIVLQCIFFFFFFNVTATSEIYTLSLHDALPILFARLIGLCTGACVMSGLPTISLSDELDRKSTRLNSSHVEISYAVFCLKKKKKKLAIRILADIFPFSLCRSLINHSYCSAYVGS